MRLKRAIMLLIASVLILTGIAFASTTITEADGVGESALMLTVTGDEIKIFSATIPAEIPVNVYTDGTVVVPDNIAITNNSTKQAIKVTDIEFNPLDNWELTDIDLVDATKTGKQIGLKLREDAFNATTKKLMLTESNWNIGKSDSLPVSMELKVSKQDTAGELGNVATLKLTLCWSDIEGTSGKEDQEPEVKDYYMIYFTAGEHGKVTGINELKILKEELKEEIGITFPAVEADAGYTLDDWRIVKEDGTREKITGTIYISGDITIEAQFKLKEEDKVYVTYRAGEYGAIQLANGETRAIYTEDITPVNGSFNVTLPTIVPRSGYELSHWVNTVDRSPISGSGGALKNDGENRFDVTAVYKEKVPVYVTVTFNAGDKGSILDDNGELVQLLVKKFLVEEDGTFEVNFPAVQGDKGYVRDYWKNTESGTNVETSGVELSETDVNVTVVWKVSPTIRMPLSVKGGGTLASYDPVDLLPTVDTVTLPTATPNSGWEFDGWYYKLTNEKVQKTADGNLQLEYNEQRGYEDAANNLIIVPFEAVFTESVKSALSLDNEPEQGTIIKVYTDRMAEGTPEIKGQYTDNN